MAEVKARATLDPRGFNGGIEQMKHKTDGFGARLGRMKGIIAGAFSVAAIAAFIRKVAMLGEEIYHNALQTKTSIEGYQVLLRLWQNAASNAGHLARTLQRLNTAQARALGGDPTAVRGFRNMGIAIKELQGLNAEQVLVRIAQAQRENGESAAFAYGMYDIFGDRLTRVVNEVLPQLHGGIDGVRDAMGNMLQVMDAETAATLARARDHWANFFHNVTVAAANAFVSVADGARTLMGGFFGLARGEGFAEGMREQMRAIAAESEAARREFLERITTNQQINFAATKAGTSQLRMVGGDKLARVGGRVGGSLSPANMAITQLNVARQQLEVQRRIETNTRDGGGLAP